MRQGLRSPFLRSLLEHFAKRLSAVGRAWPARGRIRRQLAVKARKRSPSRADLTNICAIDWTNANVEKWRAEWARTDNNERVTQWLV